MISFELQRKIKDIIKSAGNIIISAHEKTDDYGIVAKPGNANFVTEYDLAVQNFIIDEIKKLIPDSEFMAEEKDNDLSVLSLKHAFILDPIDGTTNFIRNLHQSSISLAYLEYGEVLFSIIYLPYTEEMFYAEKGKGAYLNGKKIEVSQRPINDAIAVFGTAPYYREFADKTILIISRVFEKCADIRRSGSAAIDLAMIAAGRTDMFFEVRLSPWDYAAGLLIISEAGGIITDMEGKLLSFEKTSSVIASNKEIYPSLLDFVKDF